MDFLQIKSKLTNEKERLSGSVQRMRQAAQLGVVEMTDELSMYDQHCGDLGSDMFEREKDMGLQEMLESRLAQVEHALAQLDQGTYGRCEICGEQIDPKRLERLPFAALCIACAAKNQDKFRRPVEESVLNIHEIDARGDQFDVAGYDLFDEYGLSESGEND